MRSVQSSDQSKWSDESCADKIVLSSRSRSASDSQSYPQSPSGSHVVDPDEVFSLEEVFGFYTFLLPVPEGMGLRSVQSSDQSKWSDDSCADKIILSSRSRSAIDSRFYPQSLSGSHVVDPDEIFSLVEVFGFYTFLLPVPEGMGLRSVQSSDHSKWSDDSSADKVVLSSRSRSASDSWLYPQSPSGSHVVDPDEINPNKKSPTEIIPARLFIKRVSYKSVLVTVQFLFEITTMS